MNGGSTVVDVERLAPCTGLADGCRGLARSVSARRSGCASDTRDSTLRRIEQPLSEPVDPAHWLSVVGPLPRFYWGARNRASFVAGAGILAERRGDDFSVIDDAEDGPYGSGGVLRFLTARFDPAGTAAAYWERFGRIVVRTPLLELRPERDGALLAVNLAAGRPADDGASDPAALAIQTLRLAATAASQPANTQPLPLKLISETDERQAWTRSVRSLIEDIAAGRLRKAVLARSLRLVGRTRIANLLSHTICQPASAFCYLVQPTVNSAFLGATPELLYRRGGRAIESEALAGTRPRGADHEVDERLARELLASAKDAEEQALVHDHIASALQPLCETLEAEPQPHLVKLKDMQHLRTRVRGRLREGVGDADVLTALHPTPALCGSPREEALAALRRLEPFDRGLFGGVVGVLGEDEAELAVAIRGALVHDDELRLFAGSGIVAGSEPDGEWLETELKLGAIAELLGISDARSA
ncbi:MAG: isochorismate synthase [Gemmatimonadetes bacterium]|uniref:isochorismate synthase n=1 Tax=Candidatus Kutchimonas denitrificans TaxID=3056748 RepID=A0AAE4Z4X4_9BACT|nr:isochorismate synthase [Gemmatimonadota bacterium]NIR73598.1 isochorismate synthase [Candidatus Kutchimonas denitrificans]NIR99557.1 isochorismate synthase [Gemmatimonadota bacterium]NIT65177.1 isochorismate synthase [Gemmatimonadota bacterium]NIV23710.1 isochorismate synthase [Gemmatimonadota bacterium]